MSRGPFLFDFVYLFVCLVFCLSLFETTEICCLQCIKMEICTGKYRERKWLGFG